MSTCFVHASRLKGSSAKSHTGYLKVKTIDVLLFKLALEKTIFINLFPCIVDLETISRRE